MSESIGDTRSLIGQGRDHNRNEEPLLEQAHQDATTAIADAERAASALTEAEAAHLNVTGDVRGALGVAVQFDVRTQTISNMLSTLALHLSDIAHQTVIVPEKLENASAAMSSTLANADSARQGLQQAQQEAASATNSYERAIGEADPTPIARQHEGHVGQALQTAGTATAGDAADRLRRGIRADVDGAEMDVRKFAQMASEVTEIQAAFDGLRQRMISIANNLTSGTMDRELRGRHMADVHGYLLDIQNALAGLPTDTELARESLQETISQAETRLQSL